jgi:hypothetical protein
MTHGWLSMVKKQDETNGRIHKRQQEPAPLVNTTKNSNNSDDEENDSMPAPHYQASFFYAIDDALFKALETSSANTNKTEKTKKKKKSKTLLFSTS